MPKITLFILSLSIFQSVSSQSKLFYTSYAWDEKPSYTIKEGTKDPIISIKEKIATEFFFEGDNLVEYFLEHKVLWLNSDEKIESYNKVYLPYSSTSKLKVNKARVINKEGKIIELDDSKILTALNEETGQNYKYFAFEGIDKGSFIEYFYVVKRYPRYGGNQIFLQSSFNKKNVQFDLFAPTNLIFSFKSYNNTPEVKIDTLVTDKRHWSLELKNVEDLQIEGFSAYNASKKSIVYKLDRNTYSNTKDISSYGKVSQNIYSYYYPESSKKRDKLLKKFISEATSNSKLNNETLIRKLEFFIKGNIVITKDGSDNFKDLNEVINKKIANETGLIKLYTAVFNYLDIKHEIVITSNREEIKFDKKFEASNFLTDFLIYFNDYKTYLSPKNQGSRYGFPPAYLTDNYGLFIKEVKVGDFKSGLGKVKYIKPILADKNVDKMTLDIAFDKENLSNSIVKLDRSMEGYYAMYFQPFMHLIKEEKKEELIEGFAKSINKDVNITKKEIINGNPELFGIKPIKFILEFNSEAFTEKAGKKYLFKIGELIGKQTELYQEKKRATSIENPFKKSYLRTLKLTIPEGYRIANLKDINIDNSFSENDIDIMSFKSSYKIDGNLLIITADEYYKKNIIDVANYENYRTVINSAADFNKVVLIFEPL
ncbi:DUF3857 domain-containing protein [uncultured Algibacter sp.]|uniref:DUF3857 domain-containing protein n=1 Tax=uncultured Algibacter sp. TaxID=298659 RepID=UPI003217BBBB